MRYFIFVFVLLNTSFIPINNPEELTWDMLRDVKFEKEYSNEASAYILFPKFGKSLKALEGKLVRIKGYMVPVDLTTKEFVLSANPYATCFFCGGAGPESVMSLVFKETPKRSFKTDEHLTFTGVFRLNDNDIYNLNYILEQAMLSE